MSGLLWVLVSVGCSASGMSPAAGGAGGTATAAGGSKGGGGAPGGGANGGANGNLPACAITAQPDDPSGKAGQVSTTSGTCNTIVVTANSVVEEQITAGATGIVLDGGASESPTGGTILNGDYDLIRWQDAGNGGVTSRTLRVFGGGTYIEWAIHQMDANTDGGFIDEKWDTTATLSGDMMSFTFPCGDTISFSYDYTAVGDQLVLFDVDGGTIFSADTFRRTCAR